MFKVIGDLPRIFSSNEQMRRGHSFTVPDTVAHSSEAMVRAVYGRLLTASDDEARNLPTPQTRREAQNAHSDCIDRTDRILDRTAGIVRSPESKLLLVCLILAFAVVVAVQNLQIINDPPHPEIYHQWLPWLFGPGLTPEALVWSAWTQAIILPLLGALGTASFILRLGRSKSFIMEIMSLLASLFIFYQLSQWAHVFLSDPRHPPTEEVQRRAIEWSWSWSDHIFPCLAGVKLALLGWRRAGVSSLWVWWFCFPLASWIGTAVAIGGCAFLILATGLQAWAFWAAAEEASQFREIRKNWGGEVDREVVFLRCAAVLSIWHLVNLPLAEYFCVPMIGFAWYLALDAFFMFVTMHVLGYEAGTLKAPGNMARLQCKRIAFPGKVNPEVKDCIVSFPGKYSKDPWHPLAIL